MPLIEDARGALRQVNTDAQTLVLEDASGEKRSLTYRLESVEVDFRRLIGRYVRCVVEDGVVVDISERGERWWSSRMRRHWARGMGRWGGGRL